MSKCLPTYISDSCYLPKLLDTVNLSAIVIEHNPKDQIVQATSQEILAAQKFNGSPLQRKFRHEKPVPAINYGKVLLGMGVGMVALSSIANGLYATNILPNFDSNGLTQFKLDSGNSVFTNSSNLSQTFQNLDKHEDSSEVVYEDPRITALGLENFAPCSSPLNYVQYFRFNAETNSCSTLSFEEKTVDTYFNSSIPTDFTSSMLESVTVSSNLSQTFQNLDKHKDSSEVVYEDPRITALGLENFAPCSSPLNYVQYFRFNAETNSCSTLSFEEKTVDTYFNSSIPTDFTSSMLASVIVQVNARNLENDEKQVDTKEQIKTVSSKENQDEVEGNMIVAKQYDVWTYLEPLQETFSSLWDRAFATTYQDDSNASLANRKIDKIDPTTSKAWTSVQIVQAIAKVAISFSSGFLTIMVPAVMYNW